MAEGHFIRAIKRKEVLTLAFGAMIGWSWVALTGGWINEAGSLGTIVAFAIGGVTLSFVVLRYREPEMPRPYRVRYWRSTAIAAFILSCSIGMLFMPFSPAALIWPYEWFIVGGWWIVGMLIMLFTSRPALDS